MRLRIYNTLIRIVKSKKIASILTAMLYGALCMAYFFIRLFLHGTSSINVFLAKSKLNNISKKPNMSTIANNNEIHKDLSIIVPAYNAEKTIKQCIESVINQRTKYDYELIIINDGSKDNTRDLIESYTDSHIVFINQENRGFSGARNRGIDASTGRYIMFLDSDDYLVGDCIENMMNKAMSETADIVQASSYSFYDGNSAKSYTQLEDKIIVHDKLQMISNPGFPWAKLYKRKLFNDLRFPLDVWFEDTIVCMLLFRMCEKVVVMSDIVYAYRINPEGITKKARHSKKCVDHYWVMEFCLEKAKELELPNDELQYEMVKSHMSTLLYRRISLMDNETIESAFVLAAEMLDDIRPKGYICNENFIKKDIEKAFVTRNYILWKVASFTV